MVFVATLRNVSHLNPAVVCQDRLGTKHTLKTAGTKKVCVSVLAVICTDDTSLFNIRLSDELASVAMAYGQCGNPSDAS